MLIRLAKSAPLKPGVPLAITCAGREAFHAVLYQVLQSQQCCNRDTQASARAVATLHAC